MLPDGTPFDIPGHAELPEPLTITPEHLGKLIYLAVPLRLDNSDETIFDEHDMSSLARFTPMKLRSTIPMPFGKGRSRYNCQDYVSD